MSKNRVLHLKLDFLKNEFQNRGIFLNSFRLWAFYWKVCEKGVKAHFGHNILARNRYCSLFTRLFGLGIGLKNQFFFIFLYLAYFCYYSVYFYYYLWVSLYFLIQFMGPIVIFQLRFSFIYNTFGKKFSISVK